MPPRRLSERQIARIRALQERRRQRLEEGVQAIGTLVDDMADVADQPPEAGLVVVRHGASLAIEDHQGQILPAMARQNIGHPVCGDRVVWQRLAAGQAIVTAILPRTTTLSRPDFNGRDKPLAANLTQLLVLLAPLPAPSGSLIDQYLVAAEQIGIAAILVGSKMDLLQGAERQTFQQRFAHYRQIGYDTLWVSLREPHTLPTLSRALADQSSVLVGQSGVGKSSLVKALLPDREIQIGRLSAATGLGRHTTSAATAYRLPDGGLLIDSPGVRSFRLGAVARERLQQGFREFRPYLGRCRFADCRHDCEPDCAIRDAVRQGQINPERLASFQQLLASSERAH